MKKYFLLVIFGLLMIAVSKASGQEIKTLNWFDYAQTGNRQISFEFYYFEDHSGEIGSLTMMADCNGNFVVSEYSAVAYEDMSEQQVTDSILAFAQNVNYNLNADFEMRELAWGNGMPYDWEMNYNDIMSIRNNMLQQACYVNMLPIVTN